MNDSIHGHEVLKMILESNQPFTREILLSTIQSRFGESARFHTCSAENLDADQLITFLEHRGKFLEGKEHDYLVDESNICSD